MILIADYQVITDRDTTANIQDNVYNMVLDYLAAGVDPTKTTIYVHSAIPACNQLMLPFLSLVSEAELAPDYILPKAFDPRVGPAVARAVGEAARRDGVARIN